MREKAKPSPKSRKGVTDEHVRLIVRETIDEMELHMPKAHVENIANTAANRAVRDTFLLLGIDVTQPLVAQRIFAQITELASTFADKETQADLNHLRKWREHTETMKNRFFIAAGTVVFTTVSTIFLLGLKTWKF